MPRFALFSFATRPNIEPRLSAFSEEHSLRASPRGVGQVLTVVVCAPSLATEPELRLVSTTFAVAGVIKVHYVQSELEEYNHC
jgi:hypothetical protein